MIDENTSLEYLILIYIFTSCISRSLFHTSYAVVGEELGKLMRLKMTNAKDKNSRSDLRKAVDKRRGPIENPLVKKIEVRKRSQGLFLAEDGCLWKDQKQFAR